MQQTQKAQEQKQKQPKLEQSRKKDSQTFNITGTNKFNDCTTLMQCKQTIKNKTTRFNGCVFI